MSQNETLSPDQQPHFNAADMADWFRERLVNENAAIGEVNPIALARLHHLSDTDEPTDALPLAVELIWKSAPQYQGAIAYYVCGYPDETLEMLSGFSLQEIEDYIGTLNEDALIHQAPEEQAVDHLDSLQASLNQAVGKSVAKVVPDVEETTKSKVTQEAKVVASDDLSKIVYDERLRNCNGDEAFMRGKAQSEFAKTVCRACGIQLECLILGLDREEEFGVWGGLTERDRRAIKRRGSGALKAAARSARMVLAERDAAAS